MHVRVDLEYDTVEVSLEQPEDCKQFHVLMAGEDVYTLGPPTMDRLQLLGDDELPDLFRSRSTS